MTNSIFTGVCTALVTPFLGNKVNYPMLDQLLRRQINAKIPAVVLCGTTGESATLSDMEKIEIFRRGKAYAGDQCKIIAGTGSNCTEHAIALSKAAESSGADALLIVSPYYNKANPDGLIAHYTAIADNVHIPIILYNVPTRTAVDMPISVYKKLSCIPNIIGVKEASADITKIGKIKNECSEDFCIWSGNDDQALPIMALGGQGVISVLSNVLPAEMRLLTEYAKENKYEQGALLHQTLLPLMNLMFCDVNPIPVKAAMKLIGFDCGDCRLPLTELPESKLAELQTYFA